MGFAFDDESFGSEINGFPILCKTKELFIKYKDHHDVKFIFQLYRPDLIKERIGLLSSYSIPENRYCTFIHPSAIVAKSARIGYGCSILANSVINPNAVIGNHCTIHTNCLVGHDTLLGNYNFLAAHSVLGSNCKFGNGNFIGLNTVQ